MLNFRGNLIYCVQMLGQEELNDFVLEGQDFERAQQIMCMEVLEKDLIKKRSMSSKLSSMLKIGLQEQQLDLVRTYY